MSKASDLGICSVCFKRLVLRPCLTCKGTGRVKAGLLGKSACQVCGGSGSVFLCPDSAKHLLAQGSASGAFKIKPVNLNPRPSAHCVIDELRYIWCTLFIHHIVMYIDVENVAGLG